MLHRPSYRYMDVYIFMFQSDITVIRANPLLPVWHIKVLKDIMTNFTSELLPTKGSVSLTSNPDMALLLYIYGANGK